MRARELHKLAELPLAADQRRRLHRQMPAAQRPQRRELRVTELKQPLRRRQILQPVLPQIPQRDAGERTRLVGDHHLPAVRRRTDPRRLVHRHPDVVVVDEHHLARVDPHPHPHRAVRERRLHLAGRRQAVTRAREDEEERIPLRPHLDTAIALRDRADPLTMSARTSP